MSDDVAQRIKTARCFAMLVVVTSVIVLIGLLSMLLMLAYYVWPA